MQTPLRAGRELLAATRPFATDDRASSLRHVLTTFSLLAAATAVAALSPWWPLRVAAALCEALLLIRAFILYHDFMHGLLLRGSRLARLIFHIHGTLVLAPPRFWSESHNTHHAHPARLSKPPVGTFALWTTEQWRTASRSRRLAYVLERHPITMLFAGVTVFFFGMGVIPFARDPRRYASSGLAVAVHLALAVTLWCLGGPSLYLLALAGPHFLASAFGAYLFYSQHNFPGMRVREEGEWDYAAAAVEGSSYLRTGPVMAWITGNIGYHHVHHLNARIPFYRLPEAMAALPELQDPGITTLTLRDVQACLRLNLWDAAAGRPVSYPQDRPAASLVSAAPAPSEPSPVT